MSDPMKQAWNDVGDGFSTLGRMMKDRYQSAGSDEAGDAGDDDEPREAGAALRDALDRIVEATRELGDRAAAVVRDDDVKAQVKRAAGSLNEALTATVDLIGDEVGGLFKRTKGDETPPQVPTSEAAADVDDARQ